MKRIVLFQTELNYNQENLGKAFYQIPTLSVGITSYVMSLNLPLQEKLLFYF